MATDLRRLYEQHVTEAVARWRDAREIADGATHPLDRRDALRDAKRWQERADYYTDALRLWPADSPAAL